MRNNASWGLPILWYLFTRGRCTEKGLLAHYLGLDISAVRRMVWGLQHRGLVYTREGYVCLTREGERFASKYSIVGRKRGKFSFVSKGVILYIVVRPSGARSRSIPMQVACSICREAWRSNNYREIAARVGAAAKTVSYVLKALDVLGCPSSSCLLKCCGHGDGKS